MEGIAAPVVEAGIPGAVGTVAGAPTAMAARSRISQGLVMGTIRAAAAPRTEVDITPIHQQGTTTATGRVERRSKLVCLLLWSIREKHHSNF